MLCDWKSWNTLKNSRLLPDSTRWNDRHHQLQHRRLVDWELCCNNNNISPHRTWVVHSIIRWRNDAKMHDHRNTNRPAWKDALPRHHRIYNRRDRRRRHWKSGHCNVARGKVMNYDLLKCVFGRHNFGSVFHNDMRDRWIRVCRSCNTTIEVEAPEDENVVS